MYNISNIMELFLVVLIAAIFVLCLMDCKEGFWGGGYYGYNPYYYGSYPYYYKPWYSWAYPSYLWSWW